MQQIVCDVVELRMTTDVRQVFFVVGLLCFCAHGVHFSLSLTCKHIALWHDGQQRERERETEREREREREREGGKRKTGRDRESSEQPVCKYRKVVMHVIMRSLCFMAFTECS